MVVANDNRAGSADERRIASGNFREWATPKSMAGAVSLQGNDDHIRALAERFHGVVSRTQLLAAGIPAHAINYRLSRRRLRRLFKDVYAVGPVPAQREREAAALLACGHGAVLSHATAARLWGLRPQQSHEPIEVTVVGIYRRPRPAMLTHRVAR